MTDKTHISAELIYSNGFFATHWYGGYSLFRSFWLHFFGLNVLAGYTTDIFAGVQDLAALLVIFTLYIALYTWQVVGTWRSARRTGGGWSYVARFILAVGVSTTVWMSAAGIIGGLQAVDVSYEYSSASITHIIGWS